MTLGFSQKLNGKPTHFVEKICMGLTWLDFHIDTKKCKFDDTVYIHSKPKIHTIREDKNNRWKPGNQIHFVINNRTKSRYQFAPVVPVVSIQPIEIKWIGTEVHIYIANSDLNQNPELFKQKVLQIAQNDGFDTLEDFFAYFNKDFIGKIIHWTPFKY